MSINLALPPMLTEEVAVPCQGVDDLLDQHAEILELLAREYKIASSDSPELEEKILTFSAENTAQDIVKNRERIREIKPLGERFFYFSLHLSRFAAAQGITSDQSLFGLAQDITPHHDQQVAIVNGARWFVNMWSMFHSVEENLVPVIEAGTEGETEMAESLVEWMAMSEFDQPSEQGLAILLADDWFTRSEASIISKALKIGENGRRQRLLRSFLENCLSHPEHPSSIHQWLQLAYNLAGEEQRNTFIDRILVMPEDYLPDELHHTLSSEVRTYESDLNTRIKRRLNDLSLKTGQSKDLDDLRQDWQAIAVNIHPFTQRPKKRHVTSPHPSPQEKHARAIAATIHNNNRRPGVPHSASGALIPLPHGKDVMNVTDPASAEQNPPIQYTVRHLKRLADNTYFIDSNQDGLEKLISAYVKKFPGSSSLLREDIQSALTYLAQSGQFRIGLKKLEGVHSLILDKTPNKSYDIWRLSPRETPLTYRSKVGRATRILFVWLDDEQEVGVISIEKRNEGTYRLNK